MVYCLNTVVILGAGGGTEVHMIIKKMRLKKLRDELERLTDFIKEVEGRVRDNFAKAFEQSLGEEHTSEKDDEDEE